MKNSKAATYNVKSQYQKTLNAFTLYWQAMLHSAYLNMLKDYTVISSENFGKSKRGPTIILNMEFRRIVSLLLQRILQFKSTDWETNMYLLLTADTARL